MISILYLMSQSVFISEFHWFRVNTEWFSITNNRVQAAYFNRRGKKLFETNFIDISDLSFSILKYQNFSYIINVLQLTFKCRIASSSNQCIFNNALLPPSGQSTELGKNTVCFLLAGGMWRNEHRQGSKTITTEGFVFDYFTKLYLWHIFTCCWFHR